MPIKLAVPKEVAKGERRVAIEPGVADKYLKMGAEVVLESGAGDKAYLVDDLFSDDVKFVKTSKTLYKDADIILKIQAPTEKEVDNMKEGAILIGHLQGHLNPEVVKKMQEKNITSFAMELIPRISRAQAMDILSSQAGVSGYKAAIMGADLACRFFPMLTTAAGTIRPAKVVVIGAGVAGLQAIATAKRLGAMVEGYDVRSATKEQVESLGAKFIDLSITAEGEGGYARELTAEEKQQQQEELAEYIAKANVLITTAAIPGRPSPKIIPNSTVEKMQPGAVIIDLAAEMHRAGLINHRGRFPAEGGGKFQLVSAQDSGTGRAITISQEDVNEIQLAKGAIHAGLEILLAVTKTAPEEVEEVIVAGAFGSFLNIENAIAMGLFPHFPNAMYRQVGNAAALGAKWILISREARQRARQIQQQTNYHELTTYPKFNRAFALGMLFPEKQ